MRTRWGPRGDLDYWTAIERGQVGEPERRAMSLLERLVDPYRFRLYAMTGLLPAMGNATKLTYLVRKWGGVWEMWDGRIVGDWCISIGPHNQEIPGTDHVLMLRNLIEGEEWAFRKTGNRGNPFDGERKSTPGIPNPFVRPFLDDPKIEERNSENQWCVDLEEIRRFDEMGPLADRRLVCEPWECDPDFPRKVLAESRGLPSESENVRGAVERQIAQELSRDLGPYVTYDEFRHIRRPAGEDRRIFHSIADAERDCPTLFDADMRPLLPLAGQNDGPVGPYLHLPGIGCQCLRTGLYGPGPVTQLATADNSATANIDNWRFRWADQSIQNPLI